MGGFRACRVFSFTLTLILTLILIFAFNSYNDIAKTQKCPFGKKFFPNTPFEMSEHYYLAIVTPVVH